MMPRSIIPLATALLLVTGSAAVSAARDFLAPVPEQVLAGAPFAMPAIPGPQIPDRSVSIVDFGAIGDGQFLNTDAFARAIQHVAKQGGGRVVVPRGLWLTGPIVLLDNIQLHTEAGALVLFSPDQALYPSVETDFEGARRKRAQSPLSAHNVANIAITGEGVFDGSGQAWRPVKRGKLTEEQWRTLVASGGVVDQKSGTWTPSAGDSQRPVMVSLRECRNVLLDGPTFRNSPAWNIHPLLCENLIVRNVTVLNPWYAQNGDGIDVDSCRNGVIYNSAFDVGDDAICIKSGKDEEGRKRGRATENFVVRDCIVNHGHGGFTIGSEMSGGVHNLYVTGLTFFGTDVGLRFKSNRGRGGVVENIHISDINMINIPTEAISFNLFYAGAAPTDQREGEAEAADPAAYLKKFPPVSEQTPVFRGITIRNVVCRGAGTAMWIQGLPEMPVRNVRFENVAITATHGVRLIDVAGIKFDHVQLEAGKGALLDLQNVQGLVVQNSTAEVAGQSGTPVVVRVSGPLTKDVDLSGLAAGGGLKVEGKGATQAVKFPGK